MVDMWWLIGCMSPTDMVMSCTTIARGQMVLTYHGVHAHGGGCRNASRFAWRCDEVARRMVPNGVVFVEVEVNLIVGSNNLEGGVISSMLS